MWTAGLSSDSIIVFLIISTNTIVYMLVSYTFDLILVKIVFFYHKYNVIIMKNILSNLIYNYG